MEKRTPHYDLVVAQAIFVRLNERAFTRTAIDGGRLLGLDTTDMVEVIASLSRRNFYKSMATYQDHRIWQDVYHIELSEGVWAYIKITMRRSALVIQFKEL